MDSWKPQTLQIVSLCLVLLIEDRMLQLYASPIQRSADTLPLSPPLSFLTSLLLSSTLIFCLFPVIVFVLQLILLPDVFQCPFMPCFWVLSPPQTGMCGCYCWDLAFHTPMLSSAQCLLNQALNKCLCNELATEVASVTGTSEAWVVAEIGEDHKLNLQILFCGKWTRSLRYNYSSWVIKQNKR